MSGQKEKRLYSGMKAWEAPAGLSLFFSTAIVNKHFTWCLFAEELGKCGRSKRGQSEVLCCAVNSRRCYWLQGNACVAFNPALASFQMLRVCFSLPVSMRVFDLDCAYNESMCACGGVKWVGVVGCDPLWLGVYGNTGLQTEKAGVCDC